MDEQGAQEAACSLCLSSARQQQQPASQLVVMVVGLCVWCGPARGGGCLVLLVLCVWRSDGRLCMQRRQQNSCSLLKMLIAAVLHVCCTLSLCDVRV